MSALGLGCVESAFSQWDFFRKNSVESKSNFGDGARGGNAATEKIQWVTTPNPPKTFH
jgi:hypothetical protein